ncbi:MAG: substrate-binding domain-containing protein [Bifidobacteriaceae bacterium]|jgi:phosphate transport system substrate-binding protein|nr:substrate-binding domain-containing protein [Bifidobacteriaceae bacterium]
MSLGVLAVVVAMVVLGLPLAIAALVGLSKGSETVKRVSRTVLVTGVVAVITVLAADMVGQATSAPRFMGVAVAIAIGIELLALIAIWWPLEFRSTIRRVAMASVAVVAVVVAGGLVAGQMSEDRVLVIHHQDRSGDLDAYNPFAPGTLALTAPGEPELTLTSDLPRLDGATALYPLYASFARSTYPADGPTEDPEAQLVRCSQTAGAIDNVIAGDVDVAFVMDVPADAVAQAREQGLDLRATPIGREAFVFFVSLHNPVSDLSTDDVRAIYSGDITNWKQVGGPNRAIEPYQRNRDSGSQIAFEKLMEGYPVIAPRETYEYGSMGDLYDAVADYRNHRGALGYSFRYYIEAMADAERNQVKLLAIDGVEPTPQTIATGQYPFASEFYALTVTGRTLTPADQARADNATRLVDWILSAQGQQLVDNVGYVPLQP